MEKNEDNNKYLIINKKKSNLQHKSSKNLKTGLLNIIYSPRDEVPKTNIEKIVYILHDIKEELSKKSTYEYIKKVNWIISEVTSDKIYKVDQQDYLRYPEQHKLMRFFNPDFEIKRKKSEGTFQKLDSLSDKKDSKFNKLYKSCNIKLENFDDSEDDNCKANKKIEKREVKISSHLSLSNDSSGEKFHANQPKINKSKSNSNLQKHNIKPTEIGTREIANKNNNNTIDSYDSKITNVSEIMINQQKLNKNNKLDFRSFGVYFDVFSYAEKHGRIFLVKDICFTSLKYRDIYNLLNKSHFENYFEEIRLGYSSEPFAYYHNVCLIYLFILFF